MNKQEAKQKLHKLAFVKMNTKPDDLKLADVMQIVDQIDETEKPVIPQFVADWIEVCKEHLTTSLYTAMNPNFMKGNSQSFDLILWIKKTSNQDIFARAWLDGYDVEQEKRYRIKMKNEEYYRTIVTGDYTRKELEDAGFGWVFDCEGVEVQEVQEVE